eukprot:309949-Chlamydomonas_euryale.AAC.1
MPDQHPCPRPSSFPSPPLTHDHRSPPLIEALGKEPDVDVLPAMLDAVSSIVDVVEPSMLQEEWVGSSFEKFSKILSEADERRQERLKRQGTEDFDEEELEALEEENQAEEELFDQVRGVD